MDSKVSEALLKNKHWVLNTDSPGQKQGFTVYPSTAR